MIWAFNVPPQLNSLANHILACFCIANKASLIRVFIIVYLQIFGTPVITLRTSAACLIMNAVRGLIQCCHYSTMQEAPAGFWQIISEAPGFAFFSNLNMSASFINLADWRKWRNGEYEVGNKETDFALFT